MTAATTAPAPFFRTPNAGQITRTLKTAGFVQAVRNGADGFRTERGTLNLGGSRAEYVIVRLTRLHSLTALRSVLGADAVPADGEFPDEALRGVLGPAADAFDAEHAARVLGERGYDAQVTVDGNDRKAVAVWSQSARDAREAFANRVANADVIAAEWITDGRWSVEFDPFPSHARTVRSGEAGTVRGAVAEVLRSPGSYRDMTPLWFPGMTDASVVLWVDMPGKRGTLRITPAA